MIRVSIRAIASLTRMGMFSSPSPGNSITMAPMRANTSMKVAARTGRRETSMRMRHYCASATYDSRRNPHHVAVKRIRHKGKREQQGDKDCQDLWHENQGLLLDLRQRLNQRDRD